MKNREQKTEKGEPKTGNGNEKLEWEEEWRTGKKRETGKAEQKAKNRVGGTENGK